MIGIECNWECLSCGNILITNFPFWTKKQRKDVVEPNRCGCGRKGNFSLESLKQCSFDIKKEDKK